MRATRITCTISATRRCWALLLAAGQLVRIAMRVVGQLDQRQQFRHPRGDAVAAFATYAQAVADVFGHRHVGK